MERVLSKLKIKRSEPASQPSFLSLPGEIRNLIYECYAAAHQPWVIGVRRGRILPPPLARVSRQVRREFMSLRNGCGWQTDLSRVIKVKAKVRNLRFYGCIAVLQTQVSGHALFDQLKRVKVLLTFTDAFDLNRSWRSVQAWSRLYRYLSSKVYKPRTSYHVHFETSRVIVDRRLLRVLLRGHWNSTQRDMLDVIEARLDAQDRERSKRDSEGKPSASKGRMERLEDRILAWLERW